MYTQASAAQAMTLSERLAYALDAREKPLGNAPDFRGPLAQVDMRHIAVASLGCTEAEFAAAYDANWLISVKSEDTIGITSSRSVREDHREFTGPRRILNAFVDSIVGDILRDGRESCAKAALLIDCAPGVSLSALYETHFLADLSELALRTMQFEAQLAIDNGIVVGEHAEALETAVLELARDDEWLGYITHKYPVLIRHMRDRAQLVVASNQEFLQRLTIDLPLLATQLFATDQRLVLVGLERDAGDSHNGGSAVCIVTFEGDRKVVYKPRSTATEAGFQRYLEWINKHVPGTDLLTVRVIDQGSYGWMEFVPALEIRSESEATQYYFRYGALIAALYSVNGTDIHHENLIANGAHPVVIDLETIIQPVELRNTDDKKQAVMGLDFYADTPFFTAMLPTPTLTVNTIASPLSDVITYPEADVGLAVDAERKVILIKEPKKIQDQHVLSLNGKRVEHTKYRDDIIAGFRAVYLTLIANKNELLTRVLHDCFDGVRVRVVLRFTQLYAKLLAALRAPYSQESFATQDEYLSKLWLVARDSPSLAGIVPSEFDQLARGDIPYFEARVDSTSLSDFVGNEVHGVLQRSGMECAKRKLLTMNRARLEEDLAALEYTLVCMSRQNPPTEIPSDPSELFELLKSAIHWSGDRALVVGLLTSWIDTTAPRPLGRDLYTGLPGFALALAYYEASRGIRSENSVARRLVLQCLDTLDYTALDRIGVCQGLGGLLYTTSHLAALFEDEQFLGHAMLLMRTISKIAWTDRHFDVFSGSAGAVLAILALHAIAPNEEVEAALRTTVKQLTASAVWNNGACSWVSCLPSNGATTGFAHGVSGIGLALVRAWEVLRDEDLKRAVLGCHQFLVNHVDSEKGDWAEDAGEASTFNAWCHGAPGITLFYHELYRVFEQPDHRETLVYGIDLTLKGWDFHNDSLCHGMLGNIDLLITLSKKTDRFGRLEQIRECVAEAMIAIGERAPRCGTEFRHHALGLYTGFAGIAYQLMRAQRNQPMPSMLTFDPPTRV